MAIDVKVIKVTRSENRYGKPMWILNTAGGDSIYVFDNMLEGHPGTNPGIAPGSRRWRTSGRARWASKSKEASSDCVVSTERQDPE